jgi:hypothetical protein
MYIMAAICSIAVRGWKIGEVDEIARTLNESPENIDRVKVENDEDLTRVGREAGRERFMADCCRLERV